MLLEKYAHQLTDQGDSAGAILANTVHSNYESAWREAVEKLSTARKPTLTPEEMQVISRGIVSMAVRDSIQFLTSLASACESPAEALLAFAMDTVCKAKHIAVFYCLPTTPIFADMSIAELLDDLDADEGDTCLRIEPQASLMEGWTTKYRTDFLIECGKLTGDASTPIRIARMAVEVDGPSHATDASRAYDHERDRYFRGKGLMTDRYTGKQVYHDPYGCATKIINQLIVTAPTPSSRTT